MSVTYRKKFIFNFHLQKRGNDILGLSGNFGTDELPYPTLSYANGLGYYSTYDEKGGRVDFSKMNFTEPRLRYIATVPLESETHGGEDVGIYASGPQSEMFVGNFEQSNIPILMAYAAKIGPYAANTPGAASSISVSVGLVIGWTLFITFNQRS